MSFNPYHKLSIIELITALGPMIMASVTLYIGIRQSNTTLASVRKTLSHDDNNKRSKILHTSMSELVSLLYISQRDGLSTKENYDKIFSAISKIQCLLSDCEDELNIQSKLDKLTSDLLNGNGNNLSIHRNDILQFCSIWNKSHHDCA